MEKNKICFACNTKLDKGNYKKDRTVCKSCYNKRKENTLIKPEPKINNTRPLEMKGVLHTVNQKSTTITIELST